MAEKHVSDDDIAPRVLEEPWPGAKAGDRDGGGEDGPENPWMRGLWMLALAALFGVGAFLLAVGAVVQFLWLLFAREKNPHIADFGKDLAAWLARVALFEAGTSEHKPFPFAPWGAEAGVEECAEKEAEEQSLRA